jgi:hypothetical protein
MYFLASDGIPEISEQALWLGSTFVEVMAAMSLGIGIILLLSRDIEISGSKKVLMGAGISFLIVIAVMIFHLIKNADMQGVKPPIPLMIVFSLLAVWSLYVANKEDSTE